MFEKKLDDFVRVWAFECSKRLNQRHGHELVVFHAHFDGSEHSEVFLGEVVGKESDIYLCESPAHKHEESDQKLDAEESKQSQLVVVKFARLGRTSFRTVKNNRDYLKGRAA